MENITFKNQNFRQPTHSHTFVNELVHYILQWEKLIITYYWTIQIIAAQATDCCMLTLILICWWTRFDPFLAKKVLFQKI